MEVHTDYPIDRFDPLLRDLAGWGLVERRATKTRATWQLAPAAQRRLEELLPASQMVSPQAVVYLDRLCAECHQRELTRLHGDLYVCDRCWATRQTRRNTVVAAAPDEARPTHRWRRGRPRQATTLAS